MIEIEKLLQLQVFSRRQKHREQNVSNKVDKKAAKKEGRLNLQELGFLFKKTVTMFITILLSTTK